MWLQNGVRGQLSPPIFKDGQPWLTALRGPFTYSPLFIPFIRTSETPFIAQIVILSQATRFLRSESASIDHL